MKIADFSQIPAVAEHWPAIRPHIIRYLEERALDHMSGWQSGESVAARSSELSRLIKDLQRVGLPESQSERPKMQALMPED